MSQTAVASQNMYLVRLNSFAADYYFDTFTGGHTSVPYTKHWPGGAPNPFNVPGRQEWEDITVTKGEDPATDPAIRRFIAATIKQAGPIGVHVTPLRRDGSRAYQANNYLGNITRLTKPEYDSNSTAVSTWGLVISVVGEA